MKNTYKVIAANGSEWTFYDYQQALRFASKWSDKCLMDTTICRVDAKGRDIPLASYKIKVETET